MKCPLKLILLFTCMIHNLRKHCDKSKQFIKDLLIKYILGVYAILILNLAQTILTILDYFKYPILNS